MFTVKNLGRENYVNCLHRSRCEIIVQKAYQIIQALRDYYTYFYIRWYSRVELLLSRVQRQYICFFIENVNLFSPLVLHEFATGYSDGMLVNVTQNFKARLSQLIISTSRVFDLVTGGKKEDGNIFYHYCVLY